MVSKRWLSLFSHMGVMALFASIAVLAYRKLIFAPAGIAPTNEWLFPVYRDQFLDWIRLSLSSWRPGELGQASSGTSGFYHNLLLTLPPLFGISGEVTSKFFIVVFMAGGGHGAFYLCRQLKVGAWPSLMGGLAYVLAPLYYDRIVQGHLAASFTVYPWIVALFYQSVEGRRLKSLVVAGLLTAVADLTLPFLISTALTLFFLTSVLCLGRHWSLGRSGAYLALCAVIVGAVHSLWLIPQVVLILRGNLVSEVRAAVGQLPSTFYSPGELVGLENTLRLLGFHGGFFVSTAASIGGSWWPRVSYLVPILAFGALVLRPRDWRALCFGLLALVGILLTSASLGPLGSSWFWLLDHFSFLLIFKETYKWMLLGLLGYAVLVAITTEAALSRLSPLQWWRRLPSQFKLEQVAKGLALFSIGALLFASGAPYLTGNAGGWLLSFHYGSQYEDLWRWAKENPEDTRVLWLPVPYTIKFKELSRASYDVMGYRFAKPTLYEGKFYSPSILVFLNKTLNDEKTEHLDQLLGITNVGYVVFDLNKEPVVPERAFTNDKLLRTLSQQPGLELAQSWDGITLYRNKKALPHIFAVKDIALLAGGLDSLVNLTYSDRERLADTGVVFISQLSPADVRALSQLPRVGFIIQDGHFPELALALASPKYHLDPVSYVAATQITRPDQSWVPFEWFWYYWQTLTPLKRSIFTLVPASLTIPVSVIPGSYEVFLKAYFGPRGSTLALTVDGRRVGEAITRLENEVGFRWLRVGGVDLEAGRHTLELTSGTGENLITDIVLVEAGAYRTAQREAQELMAEKGVRVLAKANLGMPMEPLWQVEAKKLAEIALTRPQFSPQGLPLDMSLNEDTLGLTLAFSRSANAVEALYLYLPVGGVDLRQAPYLNLWASVEAPNRQEISFKVFLDTDSDGKSDTILRSTEDLASSSILRGGLPTQAKRLDFDLLTAAHAQAPGKAAYEVLAVELGFTKIGDMAGPRSGEYDFYIQRLQLVGARSGSVVVAPKGRPPSALEGAEWRLDGSELAALASLTPYPAPGGPYVAPAGLNYQVQVQDASATLSFEFSRPANVPEALATSIVVPGVDLAQTPYLSLQAKADNPQRQEIILRLFLDTDGDGKQDTLARSYEWPEVASQLQGKLPARFQRLDLDMLKMAQGLAPGKEHYRVVGLELEFRKRGDATGTLAGKYNFYVRDLGFVQTTPGIEGGPAEPWYTKEVGVTASQGTALVSAAPALAHALALDVPAPGEYLLSLRAKADDETASLSVGVGSQQFLVSPGAEFGWLTVGPVYLDPGLVEVTLEPRGQGRVYLDQLALVAPGPRDESDARPAPQVVSQRLHDTRYKVTAQAEEPFYLVFSEAYDRGWKLRLKDGTAIKSYPAYSFGNLYYVDRGGELEMSLEFDRQRAYTLAQRISFASVSLLLLLLVAPGRALRYARGQAWPWLGRRLARSWLKRTSGKTNKNDDKDDKKE